MTSKHRQRICRDVLLRLHLSHLRRIARGRWAMVLLHLGAPEGKFSSDSGIL